MKQFLVIVVYWQHAVIFSGKHNFGMSLHEMACKYSGREGRKEYQKLKDKSPQFSYVCRVLINVVKHHIKDS